MFNVRLSCPVDEPVTVDFATADGSALVLADYLASAGQLVFEPGETVLEVPVPVVGDEVDEATEVFHLDLLEVVTDSQLVVTLEPRGDGTILDDDFCTRGPGYWKNHTEVWPVDYLVLGDVEYEADELLALLRYRGPDASFILAHHLVATKLNLAAGSDPVILPTVEAADLFLIDFPPGSNPRGADRQTALAIKDELDAYNNMDCEEGPVIAEMRSLNETSPSAGRRPRACLEHGPRKPGLKGVVVMSRPIETRTALRYRFTMLAVCLGLAFPVAMTAQDDLCDDGTAPTAPHLLTGPLPTFSMVSADCDTDLDAPAARFFVGTDGQTYYIELTRSTACDSADAELKRWLRCWTYEPGSVRHRSDPAAGRGRRLLAGQCGGWPGAPLRFVNSRWTRLPKSDRPARPSGIQRASRNSTMRRRPRYEFRARYSLVVLCAGTSGGRPCTAMCDPRGAAPGDVPSGMCGISATPIETGVGCNGLNNCQVPEILGEPSFEIAPLPVTANDPPRFAVRMSLQVKSPWNIWARQNNVNGQLQVLWVDPTNRVSVCNSNLADHSKVWVDRTLTCAQMWDLRGGEDNPDAPRYDLTVASCGPPCNPDDPGCFTPRLSQVGPEERRRLLDP